MKESAYSNSRARDRDVNNAKAKVRCFVLLSYLSRSWSDQCRHLEVDSANSQHQHVHVSV